MGDSFPHTPHLYSIFFDPLGTAFLSNIYLSVSPNAVPCKNALKKCFAGQRSKVTCLLGWLAQRSGDIDVGDGSPGDIDWQGGEKILVEEATG